MTEAASASSPAMAAALWRAGELRWKLDDHQLEVYDLFHAWNAFRLTPEYTALVLREGASLDSVWTEEIARRVGKTFKWLVILFELCAKRDGAVFTYGTAFEKDIGEIIVPLAEIISADAPDDMRPVFKGSHGQFKCPVLHFPRNGSVIKLVGVDKNPNGLRGRFSDGVALSECGFMKRLESLVRAVLLPQFQRRPWAFLALETSTPEDVDHDFLDVFVPDAKKRNAFVTQTLDANLAISEAERAKCIREAGGRGHPICEREYFCKLQRDPDRTVVPEYDEDRHVVARTPLTHAYCVEGLDPGIRDQFGIVWAAWDYERAKLVVMRSWGASGIEAGTARAAQRIKDTEWELWGGITVYDPVLRKLVAQAASPEQWEKRAADRERARTSKAMLMPLRGDFPIPARFSDVDSRMLMDFATEHDLAVAETAKDDPEAALYSLRDAFRNDKIEIWENSGPLADQLRVGRWNDKRTDFARTKAHGHLDCIKALEYLWRNLSGYRGRDPRPPAHLGREGDVMLRPEHLSPQNAVEESLGGDWRSW